MQAGSPTDLCTAISAAGLDPLLRAFLTAMDGVAYLVEPGGEVCAAGRGAGENPAAPQMHPGENVFAAMRGPEVRAAYRQLHQRVLTQATQAVIFEHRCDTPDVKRTMRMSMRTLQLPDVSPMILYQSQILSAVDRPWTTLFEPARILEAVDGETRLPVVGVCSFCQRVQAPDKTATGSTSWVEADEYYRRGGPADVRISHRVCRRCARRLQVGGSGFPA